MRFFLFLFMFLFTIYSFGSTKQSCKKILIKKLYVNTKILNLRAFPSLKAKKLFVLENGFSLLKLEESVQAFDAKWIKVVYKQESGKKVTGWVNSKYLVDSRIKLEGMHFKNLDYSFQNKTCNYVDNPKKEVKGIYLTMYSAMKSRIDKFIKIADTTEINAFVIDVKNTNGRLLFRNNASKEFLPQAQKTAIYKNIKWLTNRLKRHNIYAIARVVVFKDDFFAKQYPSEAILDAKTNSVFLDRDNLRWISPYSQKYVDYIKAFSIELAKAGFNEIQYDYVRFPDSKSHKLIFPHKNSENRPQRIQNFLKEMRKTLSAYQVYVSADVFGLVSSATGDLHLGQFWEAISNVVDYISPMMYPSHYASGYGGLKVPDANPYKTVAISAYDAKKRNKNIPSPATIRPWIQAFTAFWIKGHINYDYEQVEEQIDALHKLGINQYLLWNPANKYKSMIRN